LACGEGVVSDLPDYYGVLGVPPTASRDEIRTAYRRLVQRHPPGKGDAVTSESMRRLDEAFEVLNNPPQRAAYDRQRWAQARSPADAMGGGMQDGSGRWRGPRTRHAAYDQPMPGWLESFFIVGQHLRMRLEPFWTAIGVMVPAVAAVVLLVLGFLAYEAILADPDAVGFLSCVIGAAGGIWVVAGVVGVLFMFFLVVWFAVWRALKGF